jgi:tetratricopeptide (TPR) repeat protein
MKRLFFVGVIALVGIVAAAAAWWRKAPPATSGLPAPHVYGSPPGYAGSAECAKCHRAISEKFQRSEMASSWVRVEAANVIESDGEVHDPKTNLHYTMERRDGRLFVRESLSDTEGNVQHELEVEAKYTIGSGLQGRSYATESDGYLTMLPVGWFSELGRWGLNPGNEILNRRFDRPVAPECVACHNAEPPFIAGSGFRYRTELPDGIGCEQCHGPGAEHVAKQRRIMLEGDSPEDFDTSIVNPARLPSDLQQDVCLQCHLLGDVVVYQPGKGPFDFRPGQRVRDFRSDFFTSEQSGDRPGSVGHASRSMNSRCFTESGGRMTCALCHLPHDPLKETPPGYYNERCLDCHTDRGCSRQLEAGRAARDGDCVACHMPRVESSNVGHAVTTEHWIRRMQNPVIVPEGDATTLRTASRPPIGFWGDEPDGQLGAALVTGTDYINDPSMLEHGIRLLEKQLQHESSPELLFRLGVGYFHLKRWEAAAAKFEGVLRLDARHVETRPLLASTLSRMGRKAEALETLEEMLRRYPDYSGADFDLAMLYFELNRPDQLLSTAKQSLLDHPPRSLVLALIAKAHLLVDEDLDQALALVERAEAANPFIPAPYMMEAQIAEQLNDVKRGERALRGAIRAEKNFLPAHLALGELLTRTGRIDDAIKCYQGLLELDPSSVPAQRALRQLRSIRPAGR